jgi:hypothetical protein
MNVQRAISALQIINAELAKGESNLSYDQLRLLRKAKARWKKELEQFTNPKAPARSLPARSHHNSNQLNLSI